MFSFEMTTYIIILCVCTLESSQSGQNWIWSLRNVATKVRCTLIFERALAIHEKDSQNLARESLCIMLSVTNSNWEHVDNMLPWDAINTGSNQEIHNDLENHCYGGPLPLNPVYSDTSKNLKDIDKTSFPILALSYTCNRSSMTPSSSMLTNVFPLYPCELTCTVRLFVL